MCRKYRSEEVRAILEITSGNPRVPLHRTRAGLRAAVDDRLTRGASR
jgi:hypothetical protein